MQVFRRADEMRAWSLSRKSAGKRVGFVPTMGALHEGHISLMRAAARENEAAVASIFVNPAQFAPHEDLDAYPRTFESDLEMSQEAGIHVIYAPTASAMYPEGYATYVTVGQVSEGLCSTTRPHFFRGVATVVTKLFNAVLPDRAYFGQKDAQQFAVIKRMARDLDTGIEIIEMPIIREADGLAMSSRNRYLGPEDRSRALCLSQSLFRALDALETGERSVDKVIQLVRGGMADVDIDYVELVEAESMQPVDAIDRTILLAVAAQVGPARLIDNIKFAPPEFAVTQEV